MKDQNIQRKQCDDALHDEENLFINDKPKHSHENKKPENILK
jgi:hypothetical protein